MSMRVTNNMTHRHMLEAIAQRQQGQFAASQALSSGVRLTQARQDPTAMSAVLRQQDQRSVLMTQDQLAQVVSGRLAQGEGQLDQLTDILQGARDLVLQAQNSGRSSEDRETLAAELRASAAAIAAVANTRTEDGRPLFSARSGVAPFTGGPGAWTYVAPEAPNSVDLGAGRMLTVGVDARSVFADAAGSGNLVAAIEALADEVALNPSADADKLLRQGNLDQGLRDLDSVLERTLTTRAKTGFDLQAVDAVRERAAVQILETDSELSRLRDADVAVEASRLANESASLEAARLVFQRLGQQSLFDFLR